MVKCGFMCVDCKATHIMEDKLLSSRCAVNHGTHRVLKKAVMCQKCDALGDCPTAFLKEVCPETRKKLEFEGIDSVPTLPETKSKTRSPPPSESMPVTKQLKVDRELAQAEIAKAEIEMARLMHLKALQAERMELQRLLALKNKQGSVAETKSIER